jgi:hypothetical protein
MSILRQSTAVTIKLGPFLDDTTGKDAEDGLTLQKADVRLSKNGGDMAACATDQGVGDAGAAHDELGYYDIALGTADTDTCGRLKVMVHEAGALPVWLEYQVIEEPIYDALFAASAAGFDGDQRVNVGKWLSQAVTLSSNNKPDVNVDEWKDVPLATTNPLPNAVAGAASGLVIGSAANALAVDAAGKVAVPDTQKVDAHTARGRDIGDVGLGNTAHLLQAADTGATYVARAPAGTETLDTLAAAIGGIGSGTGAALNFAVDDDNSDGTVAGISLAAVGGETGTYALTLIDDTNAHVIASADVGGTQTITWAYGFSVGAGRSVSEIIWKGTLSGGTGANSDTFTFAAYNWGTSTWDSRLVIVNTTSAVQTLTIKLLAAHTGTGANEGKVALRITFAEADAGTLSTRFLLAEAQQSGSLIGYSNGAIWVNTNASNTNVVPYVDGTADNPVSTWAAALTLSGLLGMKRFELIDGSTITLTGNSDYYDIIGYGSTVALGGQSISGALFEGASITGNDSGTNAVPARFRNCSMGSCTLGIFRMNSCPLTGTITLAQAGTYILNQCLCSCSGGSNAIIDMGAAVGNTTCSVRFWAGTLEFQNLGASGSDLATVVGSGHVVLGATNVGGTLGLAGNLKLTNNSTGVTISQDARVAADTINAEVDTALNTAIPGGPTADSINERVATMDATIAILQGGLEDV